jgi:hypothetical protein
MQDWTTSNSATKHCPHDNVWFSRREYNSFLLRCCAEMRNGLIEVGYFVAYLLLAFGEDGAFIVA